MLLVLDPGDAAEGDAFVAEFARLGVGGGAVDVALFDLAVVILARLLGEAVADMLAVLLHVATKRHYSASDSYPTVIHSGPKRSAPRRWLGSSDQVLSCLRVAAEIANSPETP